MSFLPKPLMVMRSCWEVDSETAPAKEEEACERIQRFACIHKVIHMYFFCGGIMLVYLFTHIYTIKHCPQKNVLAHMGRM